MFKEDIVLTIALNPTTAKKYSKDEKAQLFKEFWHVFYQCATDDAPFKDLRELYLTERKEAPKRKGGSKTDKEIMEELGAVITRVTDQEWPNYHIDCLRLANKHPALVLELQVQHPQTGKEFKIFYAKNKSQFCDSMTDTFSDALLV